MDCKTLWWDGFRSNLSHSSNNNNNYRILILLDNKVDRHLIVWNHFVISHFVTSNPKTCHFFGDKWIAKHCGGMDFALRNNDSKFGAFLAVTGHTYKHVNPEHILVLRQAFGYFHQLIPWNPVLEFARGTIGCRSTIAVEKSCEISLLIYIIPLSEVYLTPNNEHAEFVWGHTSISVMRKEFFDYDSWSNIFERPGFDSDRLALQALC
mmetsp:Transcript_5041/g.5869  ORF Transcript_5041/g.5869 Transcript_5041/m.5869 type:complete len:208 (+) Transcript_5041:176-799(+)